ncbi:hypothetical protein P4V40_14660, partial [Brevibacillus laterosporus]|nr:hypothetical protein [Brevibacillus laterosporus]
IESVFGSKNPTDVCQLAPLGVGVSKFDNMSNRPIQGTTEWNMYRIVLDVPPQSEAIAFGAFLQGGGQIWMDSLRFEEVNVKTPVTHLEASPELPEEPINLLFEE